MSPNQRKIARRFVAVSTAIVIVTAVVCVIVVFDALFGFSLGFTPKDIPVGIFAVTVALFIRVFGAWIMRLTGGLD